jgi:hypothetical protein
LNLVKWLQGMAQVIKRRYDAFAKLADELDSCMTGAARLSVADPAAGGPDQGTSAQASLLEHGSDSHGLELSPSRRHASTKIMSSSEDGAARSRTLGAQQSGMHYVQSSMRHSHAGTASPNAVQDSLSFRRSRLKSDEGGAHASSGADHALSARKSEVSNARVSFGTQILGPIIDTEDSDDDEVATEAYDSEGTRSEDDLLLDEQDENSDDAANAEGDDDVPGALKNAPTMVSFRMDERPKASSGASDTAKAGAHAVSKPQTEPFELRSTGWRAPYAAQLYSSLKRSSQYPASGSRSGPCVLPVHTMSTLTLRDCTME